MLDSRGGSWISSDLEDLELDHEDRIAVVESTAMRLGHNDPFVQNGDRIWRASRHIEIEGQYDLGILQAAIATEGLLVATWLATQWEKGRAAPEAVKQAQELAGRKPTRAILGWLSAELGGHWDPVNCPEVKRWIDELQTWRNEIVHLGRRLGRTEAVEALEIARSINELVKTRLVARFRDFPRVSLMVASAPRIAQSIGERRVAQFLDSVVNEELFFVSFTDWLSSGLQSPSSSNEDNEGVK